MPRLEYQPADNRDNPTENSGTPRFKVGDRLRKARDRFTHAILVGVEFTVVTVHRSGSRVYYTGDTEATQFGVWDSEVELVYAAEDTPTPRPLSVGSAVAVRVQGVTDAGRTNEYTLMGAVAFDDFGGLFVDCQIYFWLSPGEQLSFAPIPGEDEEDEEE